MPPVKPITLNARPRWSASEPSASGVNYKTGFPIRQIVSEIIIQAEKLIEINTPGADEDDTIDPPN